MANRPKRIVEEMEKAEILYIPCGFCCTMMAVPRSLYENGGLFRCKKCKMAVKFRPHKIKVAKRERKFSMRRRTEMGINPLFT